MASAIRIRMYRPGFGDCFLLRFGSGKNAGHVLIEFGAHMHGEIGTMDKIMDDIEKETQNKLDLLIATHAHRDHISGFGKFAARFAKFKITEVWLPWTDNPKDPVASTFTRKHLALYAKIESHLRLALGATEADPKYALALDALSNLRGKEAATSELARGFGTGAAVRYLEAGKSIAKAGKIAGLSAEIQGPSRDQSFLTRMDPPANQQFLTKPGDTTSGVHPFLKLEIRKGEPDYDVIVKEGQPEVAHHGSENATPVDVVNALKSAGLIAMVPTQIKPFPTIPRMPLLMELEKHCAGNVAIRSDWVDVDTAPAGPTPKPAFPKGFQSGEVWIDYKF